MRKLVTLLTPAPLALLAMAACEQDSTSNGGFGGFDSGLADFYVPPTSDANVEDSAKPDAPVVPSVTVTVTGRKGPSPNVRVVFHDAAGAVIETKLTGADGKATHTGSVPAMASAVLTSGPTRHIVTFTGVENGDDLQVRDEERTGSLLGNYNVTLAGLFTDAGATSYELRGPCGGQNFEGTTAQLTFYDDCTRAQNSVLATAYDVDGILAGHAFKKGNPAPSDGGTIALTTGEWKLPASFALSVTNVPGETSYAAELLEIADGFGYSNSTSDFDGTTHTFKTAAGFAEAYQASFFDGDSGSMRGVTKRFAPAPELTLDYADLLPTITEAQNDASNARRPVLSWTSSSTAGSDGGFVRLRYRGPEEADYYWTFVVAPGATSVTAPAMPPEVDGFLPEADAGSIAFYDLPHVVFLEADVVPNYAAFRRQLAAIVRSDQEFGYRLPALPLDGKYRSTAFVGFPR